MSDQDVAALALESATRLFEAHFHDTPVWTRESAWAPDQWARLTELGLPRALTSEANGGLGLDPLTAAPLLRMTGAYALRTPLAETMIANWLADRADLPVTDAPTTLAVATGDVTHVDGGRRFTGTITRVAWARHAEWVLTGVGDQLLRLPLAGATITPAANIADEPRDTVRIDITVAATGVANLPAGLDVEGVGAAMRTLQVAGALESALDLAIGHVNERVQFGRPLAKFQAVQQEIARAAGQVAAAGGAADMAALWLAGRASRLTLAAARTRLGEAAGIACNILHQMHGAMGFTQEHRLHRFTRSALAWRDEFGSHARWAGEVADAALAAGRHGLWPLITAA